MSEDYYSSLPELIKKKRINLPLDPTPQPMPEVQPPTADIAHPSMDKYVQMLGQAPKMEAYHPSTLRKVLGTIAGIGASAAHQDPDAVYRRVAYGGSGGYNQAQSIYGRDLNQSRLMAEVEQNQIAQRQQQELKAAQVAELGARAQANTARGSMYQRQHLGEPTTLEERMQLMQVQHPQEKPITKGPYTLEMEDGSKVFGAEYKNGKYYSDGIEVPASKIKGPPLEEGKVEKTPVTEFAAAHAAKVKELGRPLTSQEIIDLGGEKSAANRKPEDPIIKEIQLMRLENLKRQQSEGSLDEETMSQYVQSMKDNPESYHNIPKKLQAKVGQEWTRQTGLSVPNKLDAVTKNVEKSSLTSAEHVAAIRKMLSDKTTGPLIVKNLGPLAGRRGAYEQWWGGSLKIGATPQEQKIMQEFRTRLTALLFQEAQALGGNRPAQALVKRIADSQAAAKQNPAMIAGALKAIDELSRLNLNVVEEMRFGKGKRRENAGQ